MKWKNHNDESEITHEEYLALAQEEQIKYFQFEESEHQEEPKHQEAPAQEEVEAQIEEPSHEEEPSQEA